VKKVEAKELVKANIKSPQELFVSIEKKNNKLSKVKLPLSKRRTSKPENDELASQGACKFKLSDFKESASQSVPITNNNTKRDMMRVTMTEQLN
jgi:hypothetical protein